MKYKSPTSFLYFNDEAPPPRKLESKHTKQTPSNRPQHKRQHSYRHHKDTIPSHISKAYFNYMSFKTLIDVLLEFHAQDTVPYNQQ